MRDMGASVIVWDIETAPDLRGFDPASKLPKSQSFERFSVLFDQSQRIIEPVKKGL